MLVSIVFRFQLKPNSLSTLRALACSAANNISVSREQEHRRVLNGRRGSASVVVHICFDFLKLQCDQICLTFQKNILDLVNEFPEKIACSLHVTKQTTPISAELKPYITGESPKDVLTVSPQLCGGHASWWSVDALLFGLASWECHYLGTREVIHHGKNKERLSWIYLLYTVFLRPVLKIYSPHFFRGPLHHHYSMHAKNLYSSLG